MEDLELQAFAATHWCSEQGSHPKAWKGKTDMVWVLSYRDYGQQKLDTAQLLAQTYGNMTDGSWFLSQGVWDEGIPPPKWKLLLQAL
jgi:hypothetical protein